MTLLKDAHSVLMLLDASHVADIGRQGVGVQ